MDTVEMMRVFSAVARQGSFTTAAKELGIPLQMASKYVKRLESNLGVSLFDRTTRSVVLNDTGKAYLERCIDLISQFDDLENSVKMQHSDIAGRIRLTAPTSYGEQVIVPLLAEFQTEHPGIEIDLHLTNRKLSLVEEGFDVSIRIGTLSDSSMVARKLADMRVCVVASPEYLRKNGRPQTPSALTNHKCIIDTNFKNAKVWQFTSSSGMEKFTVEGNFYANTPHATCLMAVSGTGIAKCPMYVINSYVVSGKLDILFEQEEAHEFGVYAIYPHRKHLSARVRSLVDFFAMKLRLMS